MPIDPAKLDAIAKEISECKMCQPHEMHVRDILRKHLGEPTLVAPCPLCGKSPAMSAIERCIDWWEQCSDERSGDTLRNARAELAALRLCREVVRHCENDTLDDDAWINLAMDANAAAREAGL